MGESTQPGFRFAIIFFAVANIAALGFRLWPWQDVMALPGGLIPVADLTAMLVGYAMLAWWLGGYGRKGALQQALGAGVFPGILAGIALIAEVLVRISQSAEDAPGSGRSLNSLLLAVACLFCALAGFQTRRRGGTSGCALIAGLWCGMIAGLMACTMILLNSLNATPPPTPQDPWKQYESLAVVNPMLEMLARTISQATWFILICPLVGAALGFLAGSALSGRTEQKTKPASANWKKVDELEADPATDPADHPVLPHYQRSKKTNDR